VKASEIGFCLDTFWEYNRFDIERILSVHDQFHSCFSYSRCILILPCRPWKLKKFISPAEGYKPRYPVCLRSSTLSPVFPSVPLLFFAMRVFYLHSFNSLTLSTRDVEMIPTYLVFRATHPFAWPLCEGDRPTFILMALSILCHIKSPAFLSQKIACPLHYW
jgi:hypothetical protein